VKGRRNGWLLLYGAHPKILAAKNGAKTIWCTLGHHRHVLHLSKYLCGSVPLCMSEVGLIGRRVSLLLKSIKNIVSRTFSTRRHMRRMLVPVWTHVACSIGGTEWSTSYF
jgi:hypothetical protein